MCIIEELRTKLFGSETIRAKARMLARVENKRVFESVDLKTK